MAVNDGPFVGWPFVNHAMALRSTQTERGPGRTSIVYPRRKFTYIVELGINPRALDPNRMETNLLTFLKNGRLYATLRSIDHPKPRMATEKLRSYNKHVIIPTKFEYEAATMSFHDDNSSMASALWKEYRAFYHYEGRIGANAVRANEPTKSSISEFRAGNDLVGDGVRSDMERKPSMGMRLKENDGRHFFDSILIYDLGADPDSINVYVYMYPVIVSQDHDNLDYEDRTSNVGMSFSFDYEGYYHLVGLNNSQFLGTIEQYLGFAPLTTALKAPGHATMTPPDPKISIPVDSLANTLASTLTSFVETPSSVKPGRIPIDVQPLAPIPGVNVGTQFFVDHLSRTIDRIPSDDPGDS